MATYTKCGKEVRDLGQKLIITHPEHRPLARALVTVDYVFTWAPKDTHGEPVGHAMEDKGHRVLGKAKIVGLKDRAKGQADAEIIIDGDWWDEAPDEQKASLLDHELMHFAIQEQSNGEAKRDDLGRPKLMARPHDVQMGWFNAVAARHGDQSIERIAAKRLLDNFGQYYWPLVTIDSEAGEDATVSIESGGRALAAMPLSKFTGKA